MTNQGKDVIRFAFVQNHRTDRAYPFPGSRDPDSFIEIYPVLAEQGFRYTNTLFNHWSENSMPSLPPGGEPGRRDLIFVPTRIGISSGPARALDGVGED